MLFTRIFFYASCVTLTYAVVQRQTVSDGCDLSSDKVIVN